MLSNVYYLGMLFHLTHQPDDNSSHSTQLDEWVATSFVQFLSAKDAGKNNLWYPNDCRRHLLIIYSSRPAPCLYWQIHDSNSLERTKNIGEKEVLIKIKRRGEPPGEGLRQRSVDKWTLILGSSYSRVIL
ncbi:hypothetical protein [Neosynechococcus sphagnicola]|uniref:hypothetical protein n=1 Tax=Neosynechococcus sphagnicola TaxID=1501145 RepID=UPI00195526DD|nr:hypothetical protein [Neosynechococcus sphagnicola]